MPRPKIHFTTAQKQEATRRKHAKYYQKHKAEIKDKRTEKKTVTRELDAKQSSRNLGDKGQSGRGFSVKSGNPPVTKSTQARLAIILPEQPTVLAAQKWEGKAQRLYEKLCALFGESKTYKEFCDLVYHRYMSKQRDNTRLLDKAHSGMESYRQLFMTYKLKILEEVGQHDEYYRVQKMEDVAFLAASGVADMVCEGIMGMDNLRACYEQRRFGFQRTAAL
ncbi:hypothetical protein PQX77_015370 [Marasmius sp. AFHP31]|nr:hypothetical protein PQX77_015370 [Marasmius sp. AFHP31]